MAVCLDCGSIHKESGRGRAGHLRTCKKRPKFRYVPPEQRAGRPGPSKSPHPVGSLPEMGSRQEILNEKGDGRDGPKAQKPLPKDGEGSVRHELLHKPRKRSAKGDAKMNGEE
jgi:hypothetical protein